MSNVMIFTGLDLMTTRGVHAEERQNIGRAHYTFTTVGRECVCVGGWRKVIAGHERRKVGR